MTFDLVQKHRQGERVRHADSQAAGLLRTAVHERQTVQARYAGQPVTLWPYALGWRDEEPYVLALMIPDDSPGPRPPIAVQWYPVADLHVLGARKRYWIAANVKAALRAEFIERIEMPG